MSNPDLLETFDNPHPEREYIINHTVREFTSLCPITGQPDFAKLIIRYVAHLKCVELRSLKQYFHSYRNDGIFYEDVTNRILNDLISRCQPRWMRVISKWTVRGGIHTSVIADHGPIPPNASY